MNSYELCLRVQKKFTKRLPDHPRSRAKFPSHFPLYRMCYQIEEKPLQGGNYYLDSQSHTYSSPLPSSSLNYRKQNINYQSQGINQSSKGAKSQKPNSPISICLELTEMNPSIARTICR